MDIPSSQTEELLGSSVEQVEGIENIKITGFTLQYAVAESQVLYTTNKNRFYMPFDCLLHIPIRLLGYRHKPAECPEETSLCAEGVISPMQWGKLVKQRGYKAFCSMFEAAV